MNEKSKLTLIVDGNWLLMSRISVIQKAKFASDRELMQDLKLLLIKSMNIVLRTFPIIDNLIFVADGGSWRKLIDIPECLQKEGITYKGNRKHEGPLDWDVVFEEYDNFIQSLKDNGVNVYQEKDIEGDDWCWYLSNKLNQEGTNVMIWSKDKDLTQLIHTSNDGCFISCWNKDNGLLIEDKNEDDIDYFFNFNYTENEDILNEVIKRTNVTKINPENVVIEKVIKGDKGDNVFPVVKRKNPDSGKEFSISEKDIDFNLDIHNIDNVKKYFINLLSTKKYNGKVDKSLNDILEHFDYNIKMVELKKSSYPEFILEEFNKSSDYKLNKDLKNVSHKLEAEKNTVLNILEEEF